MATKAKTKRARYTIVAPAHLCFYSDRFSIEFVNFTTEIATTTLIEGKKVHVDFSLLEEMTAGACVMFFAEVTRAQLLSNDPNIISFTLPANKGLRSRMVNSGLWAAIRPGSAGKLDRLWEQRSPFASGTEPTQHLETTLETVNALYPFGLPDRFDSAIAEAILNVHHHAYEGISESGSASGIGRRWWQYMVLSPQKASFIICDLGIGIPKLCLRNGIALKSHGMLIEDAMQEGFSTMRNQKGRGMGCIDLQRPVSHRGVENLAIFSNQGIYWYKEGGEVEAMHRPASLPGTVLEWSMRLPGDLNEND